MKMMSINVRGVCRLAVVSVLVGAFALSTGPAQAVALTWNGGSSIWDAATPSWTNSAGASVAFTDGGVDDVIFNDTAPGTITITANMSPKSTTVNSTNAYTFNGGPISGSGALSKSGSGTLWITGTNTYTGKTSIQGPVSVNTIARLGIPSALGAPTTVANGTIDISANLDYTGSGDTSDRIINLTGAATINNTGSGLLKLTGGVANSGGARTLMLRGSTTSMGEISGVISDGSGTTALSAGGGTWILSASNTFSGAFRIGGYGDCVVVVSSINSVSGGAASSSLGHPTTVANGTLKFGNIGFNAYAGGTLRYIGTGETTDREFYFEPQNAPVILDQSGTGLLKFTGKIDQWQVYTRGFILQGSTAGTGEISSAIPYLTSGPFYVTKQGSGTWTLSGTNTYQGITTINSGTLILNYINFDTIITNSSALTFGGGTLALQGRDSTANSQLLSNVTFNAGGSCIAVTGGSSGTMTLTLANNTWTRNANSTVNITLGSGGTLSANPGVASGLVVGSGNIAFATVNAADWATTNGGNVVAYSGYTVGLPSSGAGSTANYSQTDSASVTASETANTLKLTTTATGQSLAITAGQTLTLNAGGLLFVGANDYSITGGTLTGSGGTQKELVIHQYGSGILTIGSIIANNGTLALVKAGSGTLSLTGLNTYTGNTYLNGGTLEIGGAGSLNGGSYSGSIALGYSTTFKYNSSAAQTFSGTISGGGNLLQAASGVLTLSGNNTFSGQLTIQSGTLKVATINSASVNGPLGNSTNAVILGYAGGGTGTLECTSASSAICTNKPFTMATGGGGVFQIGSGVTQTITGVVSGSGSLAKTGSGTLILSGLNTYTGDTIVNTGKLSVANSCLSSNSTVYIGSGATLDLGFTGTNIIRTLYVNGSVRSANFYSSNTVSGITGPGVIRTLFPAAGMYITLR